MNLIETDECLSKDCWTEILSKDCWTEINNMNKQTENINNNIDNDNANPYTTSTETSCMDSLCFRICAEKPITYTSKNINGRENIGNILTKFGPLESITISNDFNKKDNKFDKGNNYNNNYENNLFNNYSQNENGNINNDNIDKEEGISENMSF